MPAYRVPVEEIDYTLVLPVGVELLLNCGQSIHADFVAGPDEECLWLELGCGFFCQNAVCEKKCFVTEVVREGFAEGPWSGEETGDSEDSGDAGAYRPEGDSESLG